MKTVQLFILMAAILTPQFILAHELDGDEFLKAGSGVALAALVGAVMAGYKTWQISNKEPDDDPT